MNTLTVSSMLWAELSGGIAVEQFDLPGLAKVDVSLLDPKHRKRGQSSLFALADWPYGDCDV